MNHLNLRSVLPCLLLAFAGWAFSSQEDTAVEPIGARVHYLEIVTPEVEATCATFAQLYGVTFGEPVPGLGNARTAALANGGRIGVRAPMHAGDGPLVRPYLLVDDIEAAVEAAVENGGQMAMPPTEIPGQGQFAIYILGGIQHGLWQN